MEEKNIKYLLLGFSVIILLMTNPKFDYHKEEINNTINNNIDDVLLKNISKMATSFTIDNLDVFRYRNFFLFSLTTFELEKNVRISSLGILGNIFGFKDGIKKNIIAFGNDINKSIKRTFEAKKKKDTEAINKIKKIVDEKKKKDAEAIEAIKKYKNIF